MAFKIDLSWRCFGMYRSFINYPHKCPRRESSSQLMSVSLRDGHPFFCAHSRWACARAQVHLQRVSFVPGENTRTTKTFTIVPASLSFSAKTRRICPLEDDEGRVPGCVPITLNYYRDDHHYRSGMSWSAIRITIVTGSKRAAHLVPLFPSRA